MLQYSTALHAKSTMKVKCGEPAVWPYHPHACVYVCVRLCVSLRVRNCVSVYVHVMCVCSNLKYGHVQVGCACVHVYFHCIIYSIIRKREREREREYTSQARIYPRVPCMDIRLLLS